jgi:hypothetical protein
VVSSRLQASDDLVHRHGARDGCIEGLDPTVKGNSRMEIAGLLDKRTEPRFSTQDQNGPLRQIHCE